MSAKLRQYEEKNIDELTYEKNKLESVLMSIANGVIVCDNFDIYNIKAVHRTAFIITYSSFRRRNLLLLLHQPF